MLPTDPNGSFRFSSPRGWQICRKILTDRLPFGPHDYQLEEITQALDGQDVVAVSATGSGKSAYIYMLAILLLELAKDPSLSPMKKKIPADPAVVVVCPTTALEDDLVRIVFIYVESSFSNLNCTGREDAGLWIISQGNQRCHEDGNGMGWQAYLEACRN